MNTCSTFLEQRDGAPDGYRYSVELLPQRGLKIVRHIIGIGEEMPS